MLTKSRILNRLIALASLPASVANTHEFKVLVTFYYTVEA